jgi:hypothetical protein
MFEKRPVCRLVVPVSRHVLPQRFQGRIRHNRSSSINRLVTVKYSFLPYGSFKM